MKSIEFVSTHRAKFHEIDPYGHVNSQHYLAYFNENRWTGMREKLGLSFKDIANLPNAFYVRRQEIDFLRPLFADDEFEIRSRVVGHTESECTVTAEMFARGKLIAKCRWELVSADAKTGRRRPWDEGLINRFFQPETDNSL